MLTEHFIASIGPPTRTPSTSSAQKDASIFLHEYQPLPRQRSTFKKSSTPPHGLAVSETHCFAAQADKGLVHVYSRDKGTQEAAVPFPERISCLTLACDDAVLVLGTVEGRIFLWELASGRQVSCGAGAHLRAVTGLRVDPTGCFLLSGSGDATVHVWDLRALLSFARVGAAAPLRTFVGHSAEVVALEVGHSASNCNFAVSASKDRMVLVWDFRTGAVLRTFLLRSVPTCLALDPADRGVYVGDEEGGVQLLSLLERPGDGALDAVQNGHNATEPVQPSPKSRWKAPDATHGAALSLSVSFDGTVVISGHEGGSILAWDVARGRFMSSLLQAPLPGPVNNVDFLPVTGFQGRQDGRRTRINEVVKPKFGAFNTTENGTVPGDYTLHVQLTSDLTTRDKPQSEFHTALTAPSFPTALLDEGLSELAAWSQRGSTQANGDAEAAEEDFMALDDTVSRSGKPTLQDENARLKAEIEALRRVQLKSFEKMEKINEERNALLKREQERIQRKKVDGADADSDAEMSSD